VESVYSAVRTESLYNTDTFRIYKVNVISSCVRISSLVDVRTCLIFIYKNTKEKFYETKKSIKWYILISTRLLIWTHEKMP